MPSRFWNVAGRSSCLLFEIRLDNDFLVFRGSEQESTSQVLKGTVVLCLSQPLKVDEVRLRLTGTRRFTWLDTKVTSSGLSTHKVDKADTVLEHRFNPFIGGEENARPFRVIPAGNYEWPFEYVLPGDVPESVEGIPEASITYRLKATVVRKGFVADLYAYKHFRIIRTLDPGALEFLHSMSIENIWPNKIDYSVVIAQKAIVFGSTIPITMRFTPLLKGLEMGAISARLVEVRECFIPTTTGLPDKEHRTERDVASWKFDVSREEHWQEMIEDSGQDGWVLEKKLDLPRKLRQCVQDLNHNGIKIRHKVKLVVSLVNPDSHISELRATLPVSIFISPNMPIDEDGNLLSQSPSTRVPDLRAANVAPPVYGEHVLDELYEDMPDGSGFQTPLPGSGLTTPYSRESPATSSESLAVGAAGLAVSISAAALSTRLHAVDGPSSTPPSPLATSTSASPARSLPSSSPSAASLATAPDDSSGRSSPEHDDRPAACPRELSRVPDYATAVRTPAPRSRLAPGAALPDYSVAVAGAGPEPRRVPAVLAAGPDEPWRARPPPPRASPNRPRSAFAAADLPADADAYGFTRVRESLANMMRGLRPDVTA